MNKRQRKKRDKKIFKRFCLKRFAQDLLHLANQAFLSAYIMKNKVIPPNGAFCIPSQNKVVQIKDGNVIAEIEI